MSISKLNIKNRLAMSPKTEPLYSVKIKNKDNSEITLADPKATRALLLLMNQHAVIGGAACHWGGPSAYAEIMSSLHNIMFSSGQNWFENFNFVNDAGHAENGIYALRAILGHDGLTPEKLKGFRSIESKLTGHGEGHLNPEGVFISNGPLGSGFAQAQGLAMADSIIKNNRITVCVASDGACMEGEAKEALAAIPGLAAKEKLNPFLMILSDNNTKLSGRIDEDSFNMSPSFDSLESLGWNVIKTEGHNLEHVFQTIELAIDNAKSNPSKPVCIVFKTIKGIGIKDTEESKSGGHGHPLKPYDNKLINYINELYDDKAPREFIDWATEISKAPEASNSSGLKKEKVQVGVAKACIDAVKKGLPVYSLSSDLQGSTGMSGFHKEFPKHAIDLGIAESNMVSAAIGFSKQGLIPIVDTFAQFGVTKGNLPLIMANLSQGPIIAVFSHTGFQDAADGASHQATTYISALASIPHTDIVVLSSSKDAYEYMSKTLENFSKTVNDGKVPNSTIFFLGRETFPLENTEGLSYELNSPQLIKDGQDLTIVACGPMVQKAINASNILAEKGISVSVINNSFVNNFDPALIIKQVSKTKGNIITIEDHQKIGGMGCILAHKLAESGIKLNLKTLGINGKFGQSAYTADQLYKLHNCDEQAILSAAEQILN